jgi:hypothetical protein
MKKILQLFDKAGGKNLLKQYRKAGVFCFAVAQLLLGGFSRKALEILRLSVQNKIQRKLKKRYSYVFKKVDSDYNEDKQHEVSDYVWVCWLQGMENAPALVQRCFESLQANLKNKKIIVITADNFSNYVSFPDYILKKWHSGIITNTHFSDLLRLELLLSYGGIWIDATVLCTGNNFPKTMFSGDLFLYQTLKPGSDGQCMPISSWFIYARSTNKLLYSTRALLYEYWIKNNTMIEYFLLHSFFYIACQRYSEEWERVPKFCNTIPHILLLELFEPFNEERYTDIKMMSCFHKLSYKFDENLLKKTQTFYDVLINKDNFNKV